LCAAYRIPVSSGTGGTGGRWVTVTGAVAQPVGGLAVAAAGRAVAGGAVVVSGAESAVVGRVPVPVVAGDGPFVQPPATVSTVRTMSVSLPFMAMASVAVAG
jgi:hypothetical protein